MVSKSFLVAAMIAYVEARFGQEQVPIAAISAVQGGAPGAAATIAGAAISDLLGAADACAKLTRADQVFTELGGGADALAAAIGLVTAEKNTNPFANGNVQNVCGDASLPATAELRGITPLIDPDVDVDGAAAALSASTAENPLNADGLSVFDLMDQAGLGDLVASSTGGAGAGAGAAAGGNAGAGNDAGAGNNAGAGNDADAGNDDAQAGQDDAADQDDAELDCDDAADDDNNAGDNAGNGNNADAGNNAGNNNNANAGNDNANNDAENNAGNNNGNAGNNNGNAGNNNGNAGNNNGNAGNNNGNAGNNNGNAGNDSGADAGGAAAGGADFGECTPTITFQGGEGNRPATEFTFQIADPLARGGQGEALNPNIITNALCNQLTNVCGANEAAITLCEEGKAQVEAAGTRNKSTADLFNSVLGFAGAVTNPAGGPEDVPPATNKRSMRRGLRRA